MVRDAAHGQVGLYPDASAAAVFGAPFRYPEYEHLLGICHAYDHAQLVKLSQLVLARSSIRVTGVPDVVGQGSLPLPCRDVYRVNVASVGRSKPVYDEQTERRWPDPDRGPYLLTLYWKRRKGRPEPVGMQLLVEGPADAERLTLMTSTLRDVKIAEIAAEERERLNYEPAPKPTPEVRVEGMRPATVRRLRRTAEVYQAAWQAGESPTKDVARQLNVSAAAAGNLVRRAREAGFLPPTSAGVPQG